MILFSSKKIEENLSQKKILEKDKLIYLLLPILLTVLFGGPIFLIRPRYGVQPSLLNMLATLIGGFLLAVVTYWGVKRLYRTNITIDGNFFIMRYTVLSFPIFLKFTLGFVPGFIVFLFVSAALTSNNKELREYVSPLLNVVFPILIVWYYKIIDQSFKRFGEFLNKN